MGMGRMNPPKKLEIHLAYINPRPDMPPTCYKAVLDDGPLPSIGDVLQCSGGPARVTALKMGRDIGDDHYFENFGFEIARQERGGWLVWAPGNPAHMRTYQTMEAAQRAARNEGKD
jgi:hypothetical protein